MALSSRNYTISVNEGDTLEKIARNRRISLDELSGANPTLRVTQRLEQNQIIYLPGMEK